MLGSLWAASGGFSASIDALNIAYDADSSRPWWRDRLQALLLTVTVGGLATIIASSSSSSAPTSATSSPISSTSPLPARFWPALRLLFMFSPSSPQSPCSTSSPLPSSSASPPLVPGAILAVAVFFAGSFGLSFYIRHFSDYAHGYGALGAVIALMLWLYLVAIAILVGAEVNAERLKLKGIFLAGQCHLQPGPLLPSVGLSVPHSALTAIRLATPAGLTPRSSITQPPDVAFAPLDGLIALELSPHAPAPALAPDLMAKDGLSPERIADRD